MKPYVVNFWKKSTGILEIYAKLLFMDEMIWCLEFAPNNLELGGDGEWVKNE